MMKNIFTLLAVWCALIPAMAQTGSVGIGTSTPNANASVELGAANKGLLLNRVALSAADNATPLTAHVAGMLVYNTATAGTVPNQVSPGIYYNNGTRWIRFEPSSAVGFFATSAGTQVLTAGNFPVLSDWSVQRNDLGSAFSNGVYTVPAGMEGWYSITAAFAPNAGCSYNNGVYLQVNGVTVVIGNAYIGVNGGVINSQPPNIRHAVASINYYLNAGDQLRMAVDATVQACTTGAPITTTALPGYTYLSILKH